jgi:hypothetical protein
LLIIYIKKLYDSGTRRLRLIARIQRICKAKKKRKEKKRKEKKDHSSIITTDQYEWLIIAHFLNVTKSVLKLLFLLEGTRY